MRPDNKAGPSGVGSVNTVAVRKGLSNEMTIQLGKETLYNERLHNDPQRGSHNKMVILV